MMHNFGTLGMDTLILSVYILKLEEVVHVLSRIMLCVDVYKIFLIDKELRKSFMFHISIRC